MDDEEVENIESMANTLRGMTMDRRIPNEAKVMLQRCVRRLDSIAEAHVDDQAN